ncbi:MAG: hypothetical protein AABX52_04770 [Nanoarchaeota archaeon]
MKLGFLLFLILIILGYVQGLPNLATSTTNFSISTKNPSEFDNISINITVYNTGDTNATNTVIRVLQSNVIINLKCLYYQ